MTVATNAPIKLIVGLGNPGADYVLTRHNVGFWFLDALADRVGVRFSAQRKFHGETGRASIAGHDVRLLKPTTFINNSGPAVQSLSAYLKIPPKSILVVHDDLDIPVGSLRLKWSGGHGGHNGLRDISKHIGRDFRRLRIGIGHPGNGRDVINYVLSRPGKSEEQILIEALGEGLDILPAILDRGLEYAMHQLHAEPRKY